MFTKSLKVLVLIITFVNCNKLDPYDIYALARASKMDWTWKGSNRPNPMGHKLGRVGLAHRVLDLHPKLGHSPS
ncbi:hypothetical protein CR513_23686, partial [Mucuna pruriens]